MKESTKWIMDLAENIKPKVYLEIGVKQAETFNVVPCGLAIGVDPDPKCEKYILRENFEFHCMTSNEFLLRAGMQLDMVFIDGLHKATQVLKDVYNCLRLLNTNGWIILHDTWPPDARHIQPDRCGDVYKCIPEIQSIVRASSNLEMLTLPWAFGLTIIRKGSYESFIR